MSDPLATIRLATAYGRLCGVEDALRAIELGASVLEPAERRTLAELLGTIRAVRAELFRRLEREADVLERESLGIDDGAA
jgi:hypothetical protein